MFTLKIKNKQKAGDGGLDKTNETISVVVRN